MNEFVMNNRLPTGIRNKITHLGTSAIDQEQQFSF